MTASATYEIKVRLDEETAQKVRSAADDIGLSPAAVAKVLLKRFGEERGFPFAVRAPLKPDYDRIPCAKVADNGHLVMPSSWNDEDDDE